MISKLDRKIISLITKDIPLSPRPFQILARNLRIEEYELLNRIAFFRKSGMMRKFTAALNHRKVGYKHNAMVVWNAPVKSINRAGKIMASFSSVSHCYQRPKRPEWNYNLYSMIHAKTKKECINVVKQIFKKTNIQDYRVLFSSKEYKKLRARY